MLRGLFNYLGVGIGDGRFATFSFNPFEFAARAKIYTGTALNAIRILQMNGYMTLTEEADNPARIMFLVGRDDLYKIRVEREELDHILRVVLRLYNGLFNGSFVGIDEREIAQFSGYTPEHVHELLKKLWQLHIIRYIPSNRSPLLLLGEERLPTADVYISPESYHLRKEAAIRRIEAMKAYAANRAECRSRQIARYFGEENPEECGVCDICIEKRKRGALPAAGNDIETAILELAGRASMGVKEIATAIGGNHDAVIGSIDRLLAAGRIAIKANGTVMLK